MGFADVYKQRVIKGQGVHAATNTPVMNYATMSTSKSLGKTWDSDEPLPNSNPTMDDLTHEELLMLLAASKDVGEPMEAALLNAMPDGEIIAKFGSFGYSLNYDEDYLAEMGIKDTEEE